MLPLGGRSSVVDIRILLFPVLVGGMGRRDYLAACFSRGLWEEKLGRWLCATQNASEQRAVGEGCDQRDAAYYDKIQDDSSSAGNVNINQQDAEGRGDEKSPSEPAIHRFSKENADKEDDQPQDGPGDR